jgi:hypothetical protein
VVANGYDLFDDPALPSAVTDAAAGRPERGRLLLAEASADFELRGARLRKLAVAVIPHISALSALHAQNPDDADVALWLGAARIEHGWEVRGAAMASRTDRRKFEEFWLILGGAYEPLARAAELRPDDPVPWDRMQWHGLGAERPREELDEIWAECKRRGPDLYEGHASRVQVLCEKWQGSNEEVTDFTNAAAAAAPPGSPLPALLVAKGIEVASARGMSAGTYLRRKEMKAELVRFADEWCEKPDGSVRTAEAHHMFGAAFYLNGDWLRARRHLSRVSPWSIPRTLPWVRLAEDPGALYLRARKEVGVVDGTVYDPDPLPAG